MRRPLTLREAFEDRVEKTGDCWGWRGHRDRRGYGVVDRGGVKRPAHRVAYELHVGAIPEGLTLDHLCRNRGCVNPAHLEAVTSGENVLRGESPTAINARKTHCIRGHALIPENLYPRKYGRQCKLCATDLRRAKKGQLDRKLFCRNGHPRTPENTYTFPSGHAVCKPCRQARGLLLNA